MECYGASASVVEARYVHRSLIFFAQVADTKTMFKKCYSRVFGERLSSKENELNHHGDWTQARLKFALESCRD